VDTGVACGSSNGLMTGTGFLRDEVSDTGRGGRGGRNWVPGGRVDWSIGGGMASYLVVFVDWSSHLFL
jgi:hypothetical protein